MAVLWYVLWQYRYKLYHTDQHRTGTDNYRYSNGQRLGVYWFIEGAISRYIYKTGERWPVDRPHGWNAGLTDPGPMWVR